MLSVAGSSARQSRWGDAAERAGAAGSWNRVTFVLGKGAPWSVTYASRPTKYDPNLCTQRMASQTCRRTCNLGRTLTLVLNLSTRTNG